MQEFIERIRAAVAAETGLEPGEVRVESPRDPSLGDFAFPCFPLAKKLKSAPPKIAAELAPKVAAALQEVAVEATGPYLNFRVERAALARSILGKVRSEDERYGGSDAGAGKTIVIDGVCRYEGPAIVFEASWDLAAALRILYGDPSLRAEMVSSGMEVRPEGLFTAYYGFPRLYPYEDMVVYHHALNTMISVRSAREAREYFARNNPSRTSDCPPGRIGHGVVVFR